MLLRLMALFINAYMRHSFSTSQKMQIVVDKISNIELLYPLFTEVGGVYWFHLIRLPVQLSVRVQTESYPLCNFSRMWMI